MRRRLGILLLAFMLIGCRDVDTVQTRPPPAVTSRGGDPTTFPAPVRLDVLAFVVDADRKARESWFRARATPPPVVHQTRPSAPRSKPAPPSHESTGLPCGGDLPPCWVLDRESGHNDGNPYTYDVHAYNPSGCSGRGCNGKWQFDPRTGDGTGSEAEQDAEARRVWAGGRGCSHWAAC